MYPRRVLIGALAAATALAAIAPVAHAAPTDRQPTRAAARAGITIAGGGYAGWSMPQTSTPRTAMPRAALSSPAPARSTAATSSVLGIDVASYQGTVNWKSWWDLGRRFAYVKATEGNSYRNPEFSEQYTGSYRVGMIRGAYHFGRPDGVTAAKQARYFVQHGGGWSADGKTLPGALDIEDNYAGPRCYGKTPAQLKKWVKNFSAEYRRLTGRDVVIYTNSSFWRDCVGNSTAFTTTNPLWIAHWGSQPPSKLPGGYAYYTFWQYSGTGTDQDRFSASLSQLKKLATG